MVLGESLIFKCNHCLTTFGQKEKLRLHVKMFHTSDKSTVSIQYKVKYFLIVTSSR